MSSVAQQIETVTIMTITERVSVMISYKGGNNSITQMTPQEVLREFGSYLTAADRQRLTPGAEWVHKYGNQHKYSRKYSLCTIM